MKKLLPMFVILGTLATASGVAAQDNPFLREWNTPFGVPPFNEIRVEHYMPAFKEAFQQQNREIDAIVSNPQAPTFENTIVAFDQSGSLLSKVSAVFGGLNGANSNEQMQEVAKELSPISSKHSDDIRMNAALFARVKAVYDQLGTLTLDPDQRKLTEETYKSFVRGGINLSADDQQKLRKLNERISELQLLFGNNLLAENKAYKLVVERKEDLAGLPEASIAAAAAAAKKDKLDGKWVFGLDNPSIIPFLENSTKRELREQIFNAYINRGNNNNDKDNKAIIAELVDFRLQKAKLMGYETFADFALEERMAKKPANVYNLLTEVWTPALAVAKKDRESMQELIKKEGGKFDLAGWDWRYYSEKVRKERYGLSDDMLRPYFKVSNVRDGIFYVCNRLYGITFSEIKGAPLYHPDVELFECKDKDGSLLGVIYLDYYARPGQKRGGAWCGRYRTQGYENGKRTPPIITIVCNFPAPTGDKPSLLSADEANTFFHEFGHALHGFFGDVRYRGIASVPRDFVELPSQIMEHWAFEPEVLAQYAKHYQTGEVIPQELVDKMDKSSKFGQGFVTVEYVAAALLDMDYHVLKTVPKKLDVLKFESDAMRKVGLISQIPPRYRSTYFQHTMTGGYTAGYYSYLWAEVLDADAFQAFVETGNIFDQETANRFRYEVLARGGSEDPMKMYVNFRGAEPKIDALLKNRGLK